MTTQNVSSQKIKPLQGIVLVLSIVLMMMLATAGMNLVNQRISNPLWGQLAVLALAGMGVYYLMRGWLLEYQYTVNEGTFYIERIYGQRSKVVVQIPLSDILFLGDDKAAASKWPQARVMVNATLTHPAEPVFAKTCFAYRKDGQVHLGYIMANDDIKKAMFDLEKRRQEAKEKWG